MGTQMVARPRPGRSGERPLLPGVDVVFAVMFKYRQ